MQCPICQDRTLEFFMEHKLVCLRCDELTFDLQLELTEEDQITETKFRKANAPTNTLIN